MRERMRAGQSPDSTYGEAQRPTFKKERRVSEQAIILFICQDRLYQLIRFYFQVGMVLIIVAQTTFMKSPQFWGPLSLSIGFNCYYFKCGSSSRATVSTGQLWKRKQLIP
ncbi:unnamed protein product, partial [Sphagnum compactum]